MVYHILNIAIFILWWRVLYRRSTVPDLAGQLIGAFVLTVSQLLLIWQLLGIAHILNYYSVATVNLVIALVLLVQGSDWNPRALGHNFCAMQIRRIRAITQELWASTTFSFVFILAVFCMIVVWWFAFRLPNLTYDCWGYHFGRALLMIQEWHLPPFDWDHRYIDWYPANTDVLMGYAFMGQRNDSWASTVQFWFALGGMLAVYRLLAFPLGVARVTAATIALTMWSVPTIFHETWSGMVDLASAMSVWMAWALLGRKVDVWSVTLAGLAMGFGFGTKGSVGYWCVGVFVYLIWRLITDREPKKTVLRILLFLTAFLVTGAWWYVSDAIQAPNHNPVYPITLVVGDKVLFMGINNSDHRSNVFPFHHVPEQIHRDLDTRRMWTWWQTTLDPWPGVGLDNKMGGFGPVWYIVGVPALLTTLISLCLLRRAGSLVLLLTILIPLFFFPAHGQTWARFVIPYTLIYPLSIGAMIKELDENA